MSCDHYVAQVTQMNAEAVEKSETQPGTTIQIDRQCDNKARCPWQFRSEALNGRLKSGGINIAVDVTGNCPLTGGWPTANTRK
jgi:hypothetical protein